MLSLSIHAEGIFREDWVWKYTDELYGNSVDTERTCREYEMCFDGVTVINDITWHNFKKTKSVEFKYKWNHDTHQYVLISSKDIECGETFLIREEDGKYFMRLPEGDNLGYNYESWWNIDGPEAPLYDFNCHEGESFMTIGESGEAETLEVSTVSSIQIDGKEFKVLNTVYGRPIVEGIGYVKSGILPYGQFSFPVGSSAHGPELVSIEDLNGNIVFTPDMLKPTTYVPMIREDRVWEYVGGYENSDERGYVVHCMKFDGTQEVQDKEYHRFVLFKSTYVYHDYDAKERYRVEMRDEPVYLLREEEGKVYAIYPNASPDPNQPFKEVKLYDFTLSDGDVIEHPFGYSQSYIVRTKPSVDIAGETCKVIRLEDSNYPGSEIPIDFIEGVGINYNGSMASFSLAFITGDGNSYYEPSYYATINRVLDLDGNVVYGDGSAPPEPKGFDENLIWTYCPTNPPLEYKRSYLYQMKFDGTTDIGGRTWHNFKTVRAWYNDFDEDEANPVTVELPTGDTFLIREEDRRYYVRLPEEGSGLKMPNVVWDCEEEEALLADFNCKVGDSFTMLVSMLDGRLTTRQYTVTDIQEILIQGQKRKILTMNGHIKIVEGMGALCGTFAYADFDWMSGSQHHLPTALPDPSYNEELIDVRTTDGTVVFTSDGSWAYAPEVFNEDWTYKYADDEWFGPDGGIVSRHFFDMKFDGTTKHYGMEYHNFTTVDSYRVDYRLVRDDEGCTEQVPVDTVPGPIGRKFMIREMDSKYFGLLPTANLELSGYDWWHNPDESQPDGGAPLYDFNRRAGERMNILTSAHPEEVGISSVSYMDIEGRRHRILHTDDGNIIAEGIGFVKHGILPFINGIMPTGMPEMTAGAPSENTFVFPTVAGKQYLVDIRDSEGKVVFRPEMLEGEVSLSDRVFNSSYIWRYVADDMTSRTEGGREIWTRHDMDMEFTGTQEIDGTTWHCFSTTRNELVDFYYETTDGENRRKVTVSTTPVEEAMTFLVRAEGQKWYVRLPENPVFPGTDWWRVATAETELYDFGCEPNGEFTTLSDYGDAGTLEVKSVSTTSFLGREAKVLRIKGGVDIVEGVGFLKHGMLPFIADVELPVGAASDNGEESSARLGSWHLKNVVDADMLIRFKPSAVSGTESVGAVMADNTLTLRRNGDSLVAVADGDAVVTLEVIGIDGAKRATAAGRGQAAADLTQLAPGVYVVRASDGSNVKTAKVMMTD
ncbi:T9SS type A sorting domain-containing protein [Paramuribaculum intestinale]|uniref:T9SS type A sorting domain-containing protein n=1 Tax=Paramuribaculum intestinale TaxID=2094151 RepID=UPI0026ED310C|nr:T9SS type A sorting domain-containing protein [Paramuribaculum intestinale]